MLSLNVAACQVCHVGDVRIIFPSSSHHITSHSSPSYDTSHYILILQQIIIILTGLILLYCLILMKMKIMPSCLVLPTVSWPARIARIALMLLL